MQPQHGRGAKDFNASSIEASQNGDINFADSMYRQQHSHFSGE